MRCVLALVPFVVLVAANVACNTGASSTATADNPAAKTAASAASSSASPASAASAASAGSRGATAAAPVPAAAPLLLGERITEKPVALSEITHNAKAYENKIVATSGTVFAVCQSMGCWMEIRDGEGASEAHVKLGGHKFFVPKTASGHVARVQAKVMKTDPDEECSQEAAQQTGKPVAKLQLEATGVEID